MQYKATIMKKVKIIIATIILTSHFSFGQTNAKLSIVLDSLVKEDQKWRELFRKVNNKESNSLNLKTISANLNLTDSLDFLMVKNIFNQFGYPGYDVVGKTGSHNFWLVVQHMDNHPTFQDSVLAKMKIEVSKDNSSSLDYAYLVDRVKVNTKQPQIYGTQMLVNKDSTSYEPKLLIDPDKVNERRKSVGLQSIEEYIKIMNERYFGTLKKK